MKDTFFKQDRSQLPQEEIRAAVITVGDELVLGENKNENLYWLLKTLQNRGVEAGAGLVLPDTISAVSHWIKHLKYQGFNLIWVCGGLGGTHDDRTREAIAVALDRSLITHPACHKLLADHYKERFNAQRQRMAELPEDCLLIPNQGGAPGFYLQGVVGLPGFPRMMKPMVEWVLEHLIRRPDNNIVVLREFRVQTGEGDIAHFVEDFTQEYPYAKVGIYPNANRLTPEVTVKLRGFENDEVLLAAFSQLVEKIRQELKIHVDLF